MKATASFENMLDELSSEGVVRVQGVGTFRIAHRAEHNGRNPATGEKITIRATNTVTFKPAQGLKDRVN